MGVIWLEFKVIVLKKSELLNFESRAFSGGSWGPVSGSLMNLVNNLSYLAFSTVNTIYSFKKVYFSLFVSLRLMILLVSKDLEYKVTKIKYHAF